MAAKILLVGLATDGPSNEVYLAKDERELRTLFGGGYIERISITASATGALMSYQPYAMPLNSVGGRKNYLFNPTMSASTILFGNIGGSGLTDLDLTYTPYLGQKDVLFAGRKYIEQVGSLPYVARVGGTKSTFSASGWAFEVRYPGAKYNDLRLISDGTKLILTGMEPNFTTAEWISTSPSDLKVLIGRDSNLGLVPIILTQNGSSMIPSGTYSFTGGTDGTFSDADIQDFLDRVSIPIDVSHVVFLSPMTSAMVDAISTSLSDTGSQPRMFFIPAPDWGVDIDKWLDSTDSSIPFRNNMIASFIGTVTTRLDGREVTRYAVEEAAIAFAQKEGYNLTNIPVNATSFYPVLSEADLIKVKSAGWVPLMRYIDNDISIYEGVTTYGENSFLYSSKVAEIASMAYDYCFQFLGSILPAGSQPELVRTLSARLSTISFITIEDVEITVLDASMYVYIVAFLPNEILKISFTVKNR